DEGNSTNTVTTSISIAQPQIPTVAVARTSSTSITVITAPTVTDDDDVVEIIEDEPEKENVQISSASEKPAETSDKPGSNEIEAEKMDDSSEITEVPVEPEKDNDEVVEIIEDEPEKETLKISSETEKPTEMSENPSSNEIEKEKLDDPCESTEAPIEPKTKETPVNQDLIEANSKTESEKDSEKEITSNVEETDKTGDVKQAEEPAAVIMISSESTATESNLSSQIECTNLSEDGNSSSSDEFEKENDENSTIIEKSSKNKESV
ncbi:unnamed protein product, partial [Sphagnum compactum]